MAQEFKIKIEYIDTTEVEIFWSDNDQIEFISLPPVVTRDQALNRLELWQSLANYSRTNKISLIRCVKL